MLFHFNKVNKTYGLLQIFRDLDFALERGTFSILTGSSGSGKTTLFRMLCGIEKPSEGEIIFLGKKLGQHSPTHLRNIGFIFQSPRGLGEKTVLENVILPLIIDGVGKDEAEARGLEILSNLGLRPKSQMTFASLSGGEIQKVEFGRALIRKPRLILADEPTAHLDPLQADLLLDILWDLYKDGTTVFISTHNPPRFHHPSILRYHIDQMKIRQLDADEVAMPYFSSQSVSKKDKSVPAPGLEV